MKHGFALLELIVATLVASMVAGILLAALSQGNRFQMVIDNTIDISVRLGVVSHQIEKDLMGAFIPVQAEIPSAGAHKDLPKEESLEDKKDKVTSPSAQTAKNTPQDTDKKEEKPLEKIFYSTRKNNNFDTLTFITNNPLVVFVGKDVGIVKPKIVRVQYSLRPEAHNKDSYALLRQESMELDLAKYKDVREYEVIGGIKSCTMTFTARIEKKDEKRQAENSKEKSPVSYEYKTLNEWVSEQKKEPDKETSAFPRIPYSVEIKLALWDKQDKRDKEVTIICQIPVDFTEPKKEEKKELDKSKKDEQSSDAAVDKSKQALRKGSHTTEINGQETVVYNGIQTFASNMDSLKKIFGHL